MRRPIDLALAPILRRLDRRIDVPGERDFPAYLDSNRFLSNLPGTTILFPVVDVSRQYINAMMYLLTQPEGARPTIVDDRNQAKLTRHNRFQFDFTLYALVSPNEKSQIEDAWERHEGQIRDQVINVCRSATLDVFANATNASSVSFSMSGCSR